MNTFINIIIALLILSVIIIFHEFGHFIFAKINGVKVNEFSLGFGPTLISKNIGETKFSLKLLPIGGACMMHGEVDGADDERSFNSKSVWRRISIVLAGPVFNFILAFIVSLFIVGFLGYDKSDVVAIDENSPAYEAGLKEGDIITSIEQGKNKEDIVVSRDLYNYTFFNKITREPIKLTVLRDNKEVKLTIKPLETTKYFMGVNYYMDDEPASVTVQDDMPAYAAGIRTGDIITHINGTEIKSGNEMGKYFEETPLTDAEITIKYIHNGKEHDATFTPEYSTYYSLGFSYNMAREKTNALGVLRYSLTEVRYWITSTVDSLKYMITGHFHSEDIGGPVRVVSIISDSIEETKEEGLGITVLQLLNWIILFSANLGVMNLLPIPALDGGRLLLYFIEIIRGKPLSKQTEAIIQVIGFLLIMFLFVFVLFNDIKNVFF